MPHANDSDRRRALRTFVLLSRATEALARRTHPYLSAVGLTPSQFAVLEALLHLGPQPQRVLAAKVLRSPNNLTTVIDHLEAGGLVERRPAEEDRRIKRVHLTPLGRERIATVFPEHAELLTTAIGVLTPTEQLELARLCKKLGPAGDGPRDPAGHGHRHKERRS